MSNHGHHLDSLDQPVRTVECHQCGTTWTERYGSSTTASPDGMGQRSYDWVTIVSGTPCQCREKAREAQRLAVLDEHLAKQREETSELLGWDQARRAMRIPDPSVRLSEGMTVGEFVENARVYAQCIDGSEVEARLRYDDVIVLFAITPVGSRVICTRKLK